MLEMEGSVVEILAKVISMATIASCLFLKVPQILYLRERQSADGMNLQAMMMEISAFSVVTLYNFTNGYSLLTYMEYPIILLQIYVMVYYVLKYKHMLHKPNVYVTMVAYVGICFLFATQLLTKDILQYLLPFCTPMSGFAKVTYIYGIVREHNADAVSLKTWTISVSTNLARLFTVYVDSGDKTLMFNFLVSAMLSAGVLSTAIYYQRLAASAKTIRASQGQARLHDE